MHENIGELRLTFLSPDGAEISGKEWFDIWGFVEPGRDERVYRRLILAAKEGRLTDEDFELIGRWKDSAWTDGRWNSRAARVAYDTWKTIIDKPPCCPGPDEIAKFLGDWSETLCTYSYGNGTAKKRFGLPRATTLLHFISAGEYPILDSWVMKAFNGFRSHHGILPKGTRVRDDIPSYLEKFCPVFKIITATCKTEDVRRVDQALIRYCGFLWEKETSKY